MEEKIPVKKQDEEYRQSFFQSVARIYHELDEDLDPKGETNGKKTKQ